MKHAMSRRNLLRGLAFAPLAIVAAPVASKIGGFCKSPKYGSLTAEEAVERAVLRTFSLGSSNQFIARADDGDDDITEDDIEEFVTLPGADEAMITLFGHLGYNPSFDNEIDYSDARQCKNDFKRAEEEMRDLGQNLFAGVKRSPYDEDMAMLGGVQEASGDSTVGLIVRTSFRRYDIARPFSHGHAYRRIGYSTRATGFAVVTKNAQVSTQHGQHPAISLTGNEAAMASIIADFIVANYQQKPAEHAGNVTFKKKEDRRTRRNVPVTALTTANNWHLVYHKQRVGRATAGIVGIDVPEDLRSPSERPPVFGLITPDKI